MRSRGADRRRRTALVLCLFNGQLPTWEAAKLAKWIRNLFSDHTVKVPICPGSKRGAKRCA